MEHFTGLFVQSSVQNGTKPVLAGVVPSLIVEFDALWTPALRLIYT